MNGRPEVPAPAVLDRNGPGPHHMTFKVADIHAAIAAVTDAGAIADGVWEDGVWEVAPEHNLGVHLRLHTGRPST